MALIAAAVSLVVVLVATPAARLVALRVRVLDRPGPLKVQTSPVPYLGGLAVMVGLAVGVAVRPTWWLVPGALACLLGLVDDLFTVAPLARLGVEAGIGAVAGVIVGGSPGWAIAGMIVTVGLINAVNLIDGIDGLAAATCALAAVGTGWLGGRASWPLAAALAGSLVGFYFYNRSPARIYLGDSGSYLIGAVLACLALGGLRHGGVSAKLVLPLAVAVPVVDTALAIVRRWRSAHPLFQGDRAHLYDQLVDRGWPVDRVTAAAAMAQAAAAATALGLSRAAWPVAMSVEVALGAAVAFGLGIGGFCGRMGEVAS